MLLVAGLVFGTLKKPAGTELLHKKRKKAINGVNGLSANGANDVKINGVNGGYVNGVKA